MKKYNWKKAAAWICTLTLLTGTLSLSSFGEIGPGIGLSETVAAAAGAVREAVEDVFLGGPGVASPSDAFRASAGDASPSAATDPDASQFDAEGMLIDGIALIDDISTPSDALMMMAAPKLLKAPPSAADPDMAALFTALSEVCEAWDGGDVIIAEDLSDCGVKSEDVNEYFEIFIHAYPEFFFLSHQLPEWKVTDGVVSRMELYTLAGEVSAADAAYFDEVVSEITEGIPEGADAELAALYLHDWICAHCSYNKALDGSYSADSRLSYSAYGALIGGTAACQGYALAYQCLLDKAYEAGFGTDAHVVWSDNHTWNAVNTGTETSPAWLWADCTQDDPNGMYDAYFDHQYFLKSSEALTAAAPGVYGTDSAGWRLDTGEYADTLAGGSAPSRDFWNRVIGQIPCVDGNWYFVDSEDETTHAGPDGKLKVCYYDSAAGTVEVFSDDMIPGCWGNEETWYDVSYAHFAVEDGEIYLSSKESIWRLDPGGTAEMIYALSDEEKQDVFGNALYICGIWTDKNAPGCLWYSLCAISGSGASLNFMQYYPKRLNLSDLKPQEDFGFFLSYGYLDVTVGETVTIEAHRVDDEPVKAGMLSWSVAKGSECVSMEVAEDGASVNVTALRRNEDDYVYAEIRASNGYSEYSCNIWIYDRLEGIRIANDYGDSSPLTMEITTVEAVTENLYVYPVPDTARMPEGTSYLWIPGDEEVAVLNGDGEQARLTAKGAGTTEIRLEAAGFRTALAVTVTDKTTTGALRSLRINGEETDISGNNYGGWTYGASSAGGEEYGEGWFYSSRTGGEGILVLSNVTSGGENTPAITKIESIEA